MFNEDEICEIFAQEFTKKFSEPTIRTKSHVQSIYSTLIGKSQSKHTVNIDYRSVLEVLLNCPHTAAGPDGLSGKLYHILAYVLATPLTIIYQQSIYQTKIPSDWRLVKVIPLYKGKGNKSDTTSYRPVSLTSVACKLLERLITQQIKEYLEATNALHNAQHGFRSNRSTTSNMLIYDMLIAEALNERAECHVIIIDFKRAFDKIDHSILISKLSNFGIDSNIVFWIKDFLSNRQQYVVYGDSISRMTPVTSGVIQVSVIGALVFTLFIKDLLEMIKHVTILMFADDVKLVQPVK